jgi:ferritin-like protein
MGKIETKYDLTKALTIIKAVGKMKADDFHEWTANYYNGTVTSLALWDLTEADLSEIQTEDLRNDAEHTKALAERRKGGKTAIVSANSLEYGLSRMLETFYDMEEVPFETQVFHTINEAMKWLSE